jgi:drug/metabolite transporter (DMT)-like permease
MTRAPFLTATATAALVLISLIWGSTFVVIKDTLEAASPPLLLAVRFTLASLLLAWVRPQGHVWGHGIFLGVLAFIAFATQTIGLQTTSSANAAFITGLCVIITPLLGHYLAREQAARKDYAAAGLALLGLAGLTLGSSQGMGRGDLWVIITAFGYAFYILYTAKVAHLDFWALTASQLITMAVLSWAWALPQLGQLARLEASDYLNIFYLASVCTVLTTILQLWGQRYVAAHVAALIFILEPLSAALFGYWFLSETLGILQGLGAVLILAAMAISQKTAWRWCLRVIARIQARRARRLVFKR